jgi:alkylation response protein AidB-like acyl-CoA dehydrogenase
VTGDPSLVELAEAAASLGELRGAARTILGRAWSPTRFRDLLDRDEPAFDAPLWSTLRSLGWSDVLLPAEKGGGDGTVAQLCTLAEEVGAAGAPVPLSTAAAAAWCEGRPVQGTPVMFRGPTGRLGAPGMTVSGAWPVVPFGAVATRLLLLAHDPDGAASIVAVDPDQNGVRREALVPLDHGPAAAITLAEAVVDVVDDGPDATERWAATIRLFTLSTVAELVGVAAAANDAACRYAQHRMAFDRPIGSFQAIKHRLVNQRAAIEVARALTTRAADASDHHHPSAGALTSLAAFWATDSLRAVPEGAIQVFGGIGFTWEHEAHGHLRRAACLTASLGPRAHHRDRALRWLTNPAEMERCS